MIEMFSELPAYEFTEVEIANVLGDEKISGTCLLQTAKVGGSAVTSSSADIKADLLQILRGEKRLNVAQAPYRYWKYMANEAIERRIRGNVETMNEVDGMEQDVLKLAHAELLKGNRRVPLDVILSLPTVRAQIHRANEIPDDLLRIFSELEEDGYLSIHDIMIGRVLGGGWTVGVGSYPAISLTSTGRTWIATQLVAGGESKQLQHYSSQEGDGLLINPTVFRIPEDMSHSERGKLVAVMIPFKKEFDGVYSSIKDACDKLGFTARKVDDIWQHQTIIEEIFTLICRADIVVVDFSGSNSNVMYETGIAHTLGKKVIPLAQNIDTDVPFDTRHHRVLKYVANEQGLNDLTQDLYDKLRQYL